MEMTISKKQLSLKEDIKKENLHKLSVLGSTQSGKTHIICWSVIEYAQALHKYDPIKHYSGAIIGWSQGAIDGNIVDVLESMLQELGYTKKERGKGDYTLRKDTKNSYIQLWNIKFFFFGFNNVLAFNNILGKPLIFIWVDESARIYSEKQLQKSFNELPGRQISFVKHPYVKRIHSFNSEGGENHDYKKDFLDKQDYDKSYTFYPYDNPILDTEAAIKAVVETFPPGSLREQKIYCKWTVAEGKVFNYMTEITDDEFKDLIIREIGIGIDYGSVNATVFVPIALAYSPKQKKWVLVKLECYYHDTIEMKDNPTTEYFSKQLRYFLLYLSKKYPGVPIYDIVIDSEATHFINRLEADNIPHRAAKKGADSVDRGVQLMQSLFYKKYYQVLKKKSIKHFYTADNYDLCNKDEVYIEYDSYEYDRVRSEREGRNCYKKINDHGTDGSRYLIQRWQEIGKTPTV